jgi:hypothetical protein
LNGDKKPSPHETSVHIRESKVRVALAVATPPLLLGMAILTLAVDSPIAVPITFGILGTFLGVTVLFDFPIALILNDAGLERVSLLRRHAVTWDDVGAIVKPRRRGLILITTARKRYVLIDRILEADERNLIMNKGDEHGFQVEI